MDLSLGLLCPSKESLDWYLHGGCWMVYYHHGHHFRFFELKRNGFHDSVLHASLSFNCCFDLQGTLDFSDRVERLGCLSN